MNSPQRQIVNLMRRFGDTVTLLRSGVGRTMPCFLTPLDNSTTNIYFDANESVGLLRPALALYVSGTEADPPLLNDVFFDHGRQFTVRKTQYFNVAGAPVVIIALCD